MKKLLFFASNKFYKWVIPGLFFIHFRSFQTTKNLQQIYMKKVHPVYGAGIRTHILLIMILLPYPLDRGSNHLV